MIRLPYPEGRKQQVVSLQEMVTEKWLGVNPHVRLRGTMQVVQYSTLPAFCGHLGCE
jgi:hypothetical protein